MAGMPDPNAPIAWAGGDQNLPRPTAPVPAAPPPAPGSVWSTTPGAGPVDYAAAAVNNFADWMRANVPAPVRAVAEPIGVGLHQLVGGAAYAASAVPRVLGMPGAADAMSNFAATASATNEPDIQGVEQGGYFANGVGGFLKKAAVTGLEMAPMLAGIGGLAGAGAEAAPYAARLTAMGVPVRSAAPGIMGKLSQAIPEIAGGTGSNQLAAAAAGVMTPLAVGGIEQQADQKPGGATQLDAAKALMFGVPVGMIQAMFPASVLEKANGTLMSRMAATAFGGAAFNTVGSGLQTAAEMTVRPDLSTADKAHMIAESAASGAITGGLMGGVLGMRGGAPTNDAIKAQIDTIDPDQAAAVKAMAPTAPPAPDFGQRAAPATPAAEPVPPIAAAETPVPGAPVPPAAETPVVPVPPAAETPAVPVSQVETALAEPTLAQKLHVDETSQIPIAKQVATNADVAPRAASSGVVGDFLKGSQAKNLPEFYNEVQAAVDQKLPVTDTKSFDKLATHLGIARDLDAELAKSPDSPKLENLIALRDQAAALKPTPDTATAIQEPGVVQEPGAASENSGGAGSPYAARDATPAEVAPRETPPAPPEEKGPAIQDIGTTPEDLTTPRPDDVPAFLKGIGARADVGPELFRGSGRGDVSTVYNPTGSPVPIAGQGRYFSFDPAHAATFGPNIEKANLAEVVQKPLTITSGQQWTALTKEAGWKFPNPYGTDPAQMTQQTQALKDTVLGKGYDGLVVRWNDAEPTDTGPKGEDLKLLRNVFDKPQVVSYQPDPVVKTPLASYSDAPNSAPMPAARIDRIVANRLATDRIRPDIAARVHVLDNASQLPPDVQASAAQAKFDLNNLMGLYHNQRAYIFRDQMRTPLEVEQTLSHEALAGHMATMARVGEQGTPEHTATMADVFDRMGGSAGAQKLAQRFGVQDSVAQYFPANGFEMSDAEKANAAEEIIAHASEPGRTGPLQQALLAIVGKFKQAIAAKLDDVGLHQFAAKFKTFGASDVAKWVEDNRTAMQGTQRPVVPGANYDNPAQSMLAKRPEAADDVISRGMQEAAKIGDWISSQPIQSFRMKLMGLRDMVRSWGEKLPALGVGETLHQARAAITAAIGDTTNVNNRGLLQYSAFKQSYANLQYIISTATKNKFDLTKPWSAQTWLHMDPDDPTQPNPRLAELQSEFNRAQGVYNTLGQPAKDGAPPGVGQNLYRERVQLEQGHGYMQMAEHLFDMVSRFLPGKVADFPDQSPSSAWNQRPDHRNISAYNQHGNAALTQMQSSVQTFLDGLHGQGELPDYAKPFEKILAENTARMQAMNQAPHFTLGRNGDFFTAFTLRAGPDGRIDPAALKAAETRMNAGGMGDVDMNALSSDRRTVYTRHPTTDNAQAMADLAYGLQKDGFLDTEKGITTGPIGAGKIFDGAIPFADHLLANAEKQNSSDPNQLDILAAVRALQVDLLPPNSVRQLWEKRENVLGSSKDMVSSMGRSDAMVANSLASLATNYDMAKNDVDLQAQAGAFKGMGNTALASKMQGVADEYMTRRTNMLSREPHSYIEALTAIAHTWQLGGSPAFMAMQVMQNPLLGWPEFAKKFGFVNSGAALISTAPKTMRIMMELLKNPLDGFNDAMLGRAGLNQSEVAHVLDMRNRAMLESGSFAQAQQGGTVGHGAINRWMQYANMTATFAEVNARLSIILSAKHLADARPDQMTGFNSVGDYTHHVLGESMFNWGNYDTPRGFSAKGGFMGPMSPMVFKFHQFQSKYWSKLLPELVRSFGGMDASPETRAESQRFMMAHLAAATVLTGTLGLPAAGLMAGLFTRMSDLFTGGQGYDVVAHYRDFLREVFGHDTSEMLARGLPRTLGVDAADWGVAEAPFTRFIEDRRKWEDALPDALSRAWGAPISMIGNSVTAMRDFYNGVPPTMVMAHFLPTSLRNIARAYNVEEHGYVDHTGKPMPLEHGALDALQQAVGLTPGAYSEAMEGKEIESGAEEARQARSQVIEEGYARALQNQDTEGMSKWRAASLEFNMKPENRGMQMNLQGGVSKWMQEVGQSRATGLPLGTPMKDVYTRKLLSYMK
jgi:hypothetical protein